MGQNRNDEFGYSIALSGTTLVVGARAYRANNIPRAGHVQVCSYTGSTWQPRGTNIDGVISNEQSGSWVAMSADGTAVALASPSIDLVRVHRFNGTNWMQVGNDLVGTSQSMCGATVALSSNGSVLAVSAPLYDSSSLDNIGRIQVFQLSTSDTWDQLGAFVDGEAEDGIGFRMSIALSGSGSILA